MNVVTLTTFDDYKKGVRRYPGEEFVVTKARFEEINRIAVEKTGAPFVKEATKRAEKGK